MLRDIGAGALRGRDLEKVPCHTNAREAKWRVLRFSRIHGTRRRRKWPTNESRTVSQANRMILQVAAENAGNRSVSTSVLPGASFSCRISPGKSGDSRTRRNRNSPELSCSSSWRLSPDGMINAVQGRSLNALRRAPSISAITRLSPPEPSRRARSVRISPAASEAFPREE